MSNVSYLFKYSVPPDHIKFFQRFLSEDILCVREIQPNITSFIRLRTYRDIDDSFSNFKNKTFACGHINKTMHGSTYDPLYQLGYISWSFIWSDAEKVLLELSDDEHKKLYIENVEHELEYRNSTLAF